MADVFFGLSYKSFTIICFHANFFSFSFVDKQNTYSCKSDLFTNLKKNSVQFIFFHALWMAIFLSFYFSTVSSSRRCWSLDLVRVCLFVMSIFNPPFFFHIAFPWVGFLFFLFWAESDDNAWIIVSAVYFFFPKTLLSSFHPCFHCIACISVLRRHLAFLAFRQG